MNTPKHISDDTSRELLPCPECGKRVHTKPAENVPNQGLRGCDECDAVFFMDMTRKPVYPAQPIGRTHKAKKAQSSAAKSMQGRSGNTS